MTLKYNKKLYTLKANTGLFITLLSLLPKKETKIDSGNISFWSAMKKKYNNSNTEVHRVELFTNSYIVVTNNDTIVYYTKLS